MNVFITGYVLQWGVVSTSPNLQAGGPPLVRCPRLLIQYIHSYPPYLSLFLYPWPEDVPCRGDRDPCITVSLSHTYKNVYQFKYIKHKALGNSVIHTSFHEMTPRFLENFGSFTCSMSTSGLLCMLLLNSFFKSAHWRAVLYIIGSFDSHLAPFSKVLSDKFLHFFNNTY